MPSSLLLGVTTYISAEITPMPFLWVIPLALYLLTLRAGLRPADHPAAAMDGPPATCVDRGDRRNSAHVRRAGLREVLLFGSLHLATFFVTAMVCHGQLAADRPAPSHLTEFYLWMSLGGVLGGLFNALVAPVVFNSVLEYPLMMAAACLLAAAARSGRRQVARRQDGIARRGPVALPDRGLGAALGQFSLRPALHRYPRDAVRRGGTGRLRHVSLAAAAGRVRNRRGRAGGDQPVVGGNGHPLAPRRAKFLRHPSRGARSRMEHAPIAARHDEPRSAESLRKPAARTAGILSPHGTVGTDLRQGSSLRRPLAEVGVLGLGVGTIAAYAEPGERFTFYEIDPAVERIARNPDYFTYLADCRGKVEVVLGDARLSLEHGPRAAVRSADRRRLQFRLRARSPHDPRGLEDLL